MLSVSKLWRERTHAARGWGGVVLGREGWGRIQKGEKDTTYTVKEMTFCTVSSAASPFHCTW